jgi:hypothetical protein
LILSAVRRGLETPEERRLKVVRRRAASVLLITSFFFVPVPFCMLFVVGMLPFAWITAFFVAMGMNYFLIILFAIHIVIDIGILFLGCTTVSRLLFRIFSTRNAIFLTALVVALELGASFLSLVLGERDWELFNPWILWTGALLNIPR